MKEMVSNDIRFDQDIGVWMIEGAGPFKYSDGAPAERYLHHVFNRAADLSSDSFELESYIKDWPSEYHLTRKRAQLLRGFQFDRSMRVLEVGCGCGAITRLLGETFDSVTAVEGSRIRASLARLRTKDMENVSILSAPFQEVKFREKFDIIFCIGVLEYANVFVDAPDPYESMLSHFSRVLDADGVVIVAIENQFGLKYFSSCKEDHTNVMFDGIEGYPRYGKKAKTFGYFEIRTKLEKYFAQLEFYYPFPDYKIPSCVLSEEFLNGASCAELIGNFRARNYEGIQERLFDERLTLFEIEKNQQLPFFANSFLIVAGKAAVTTVSFPYLGVMYSSGRLKQFHTETYFEKAPNGDIKVKKIPIECPNEPTGGLLKLRRNEESWISGLSLNAVLLKRIKRADLGIEELFSPCRNWIEHLEKESWRSGDRLIISGSHIDSIWRNCFIEAGECVFIDREWEWEEDIELNVLVIRCVYHFLVEEVYRMKDIHPAFRKKSVKALIRLVASSIDITLVKSDFDRFCELESKIQSIVVGGSRSPMRMRAFMSMVNYNRASLKQEAFNLKSAIGNSLRRKFGSALVRMRQK